MSGNFDNYVKKKTSVAVTFDHFEDHEVPDVVFCSVQPFWNNGEICPETEGSNSSSSSNINNKQQK